MVVHTFTALNIRRLTHVAAERLLQFVEQISFLPSIGLFGLWARDSIEFVSS